MSQQDKEARALKRQIRHVLRASGGRLELGERVALLRSIGQFIGRTKFESREEVARALGVRPRKLNYVLQCYRKLLQAEKRAAGSRGAKKLKLAPIKIVDEPVKSRRPEPRRVDLVLESGVRLSVESADAAIELLDRLDQRKRLRAAS